MLQGAKDRSFANKNGHKATKGQISDGAISQETFLGIYVESFTL